MAEHTFCEDCGEEVERPRRRVRCFNCKMLLCGWCYNHCHALALSVGDDGCGIRPKFNERAAAHPEERKRT